MNPITLELMTNYRYPSALEARNNKLYYVETIADITKLSVDEVLKIKEKIENERTKSN